MDKEKNKTESTNLIKQQFLRNPDIEPTIEVISEALGKAQGAYIRFVSELDKLNIQLEWQYYTDGKAWLAKGIHNWTGTRGGKKESTIFWLSIWDGLFKITIYIPKKAYEDMFLLPIDNELKQMISNSRQMGEKLKYFPIVFEVDSFDELEAVYILFNFKKSIK